MEGRSAVEVVREFIEAANARDVGRATDLLGADVEWHNMRELPGGGVHRGPAGVERALRDQAELLRDYRAEPEHLADVGDQVVARVRIRGLMRDSDYEVDMAVGQVWTVRGGRITRFRAYLDPEEALAVARSEDEGGAS